MLMFDKKNQYPQKTKTRKVQTTVDLRKMRRIDELRASETESTFLGRALTLYVWV